jgi:hypothetical protein
MPEVTPTGSTDNLGAFDPQRKVHVASYSARDGVEKGWPATATVELGGALVEGRVTSRAGIDPGVFGMLVLPRTGSLCALQTEHPELLWAEDRPPFLLGLGFLGIGHLSDD